MEIKLIKKNIYKSDKVEINFSAISVLKGNSPYKCFLTLVMHYVLKHSKTCLST